MDKYKKYHKIRSRLENVAFVIALLIGDIINSCLGIKGEKFISLDTLLCIVIITVLGAIFNSIAVRIADKWYAKNKDN